VDFGSHSQNHAIGTGRGNGPELVGIGGARRARVVGARLEYRSASGAVHLTDTFDEPARRLSRVGEHPQLAVSKASAADRKQPVARTECGAHGVVDDRETTQWPGPYGMVSGHSERVG